MVEPRDFSVLLPTKKANTPRNESTLLPPKLADQPDQAEVIEARQLSSLFPDEVLVGGSAKAKPPAPK